jgi:hypothetical protein
MDSKAQEFGNQQQHKLLPNSNNNNNNNSNNNTNNSTNTNNTFEQSTNNALVVLSHLLELLTTNSSEAVKLSDAIQSGCARYFIDTKAAFTLAESKNNNNIKEFLKAIETSADCSATIYEAIQTAHQKIKEASSVFEKNRSALTNALKHSQKSYDGLTQSLPRTTQSNSDSSSSSPEKTLLITAIPQPQPSTDFTKKNSGVTDSVRHRRTSMNELCFH